MASSSFNAPFYPLLSCLTTLCMGWSGLLITKRIFSLGMAKWNQGRNACLVDIYFAASILF